jgi:HIV Tat-specific factor 1
MTENDDNVKFNSDIFTLEWYYIDVTEKQPKGPISIRDIDVMLRTNTIDSNTYVWREGMNDWKKLYQLNELKDIASTTHTEIQESLIRTKIQNSFNNLGQKIENNAVDNFYFGSDGFWHVFNPITKIWTTQEKKPINRRKSFDFAEDEMEKPEYRKNLEDKIDGKNFDYDSPLTPNPTPIGELQNQSEEINEDGNSESLSLLKRKRENSIDLSSIIDSTETSTTEKVLQKMEKKKKKTKKQKEKKMHQWYMPRVNSNVYVSGLPKDISQSEVVSYFSRCGFIRKDQRTGETKVKIYKDESGKNKGDAMISFLREESVIMAIDLLNDTEIRPGYSIKVERAQFEQKGDYKPRESYKMDYLQRYKHKTDVNRMLGWNEAEDEQGLRIVILKNLFEPIEFFEDEGLRQDLELDIVEECENNFGQIERFHIFEEHPEGIIKIKFKTPIAAEKCIEGLNHRYYNGKLIEAFYWDGKTDYNKFQEDNQSQEKRIEEFGQWLENSHEHK